MNITLNIIPGPLPNICESAHERPIPPRSTCREHPQCLSELKIVIIQPCEPSHCRIAAPRNAKVEAGCQTQASHEPVVSSPKRATEAETSLGKRVSSPAARFSAFRKPSTLPTSSNNANTLSKIPYPSIHAFNPKKLEVEKMTTFPSNSTMSSNPRDYSQNHELTTLPRSTSSSAQKPKMSAQADETVRVMDWAISMVKAAEKRVRQEERAAHEKEVFELRLRVWEAEMKLRKLEENAEEEKRKEESQPVDELTDPKISWKGDQLEMGRCRQLILDAQRPCRRGLAVVLER